MYGMNCLGTFIIDVRLLSHLIITFMNRCWINTSIFHYLVSSKLIHFLRCDNWYLMHIYNCCGRSPRMCEVVCMRLGDTQKKRI